MSRSASGDGSIALSTSSTATRSSPSPRTGSRRSIVHVATAIPDDIDPRRAVEQFEPTNRLRTEGTANLRRRRRGGGRRPPDLRERRLHGPPRRRARVRGGPAARRARRRHGAHRRCTRGARADDAGGRRRRAQVRALLRPRDRLRRRRGDRVDDRETADADPDADRREPGPRSLSSTSRTQPGRQSSAIESRADGRLPRRRRRPRPGLGVDSGPRRRDRREAAPMRLPAWLARPMVGAYGVEFMCGLRGASNARAKAELGWTPSPSRACAPDLRLPCASRYHHSIPGD